MKSKKIKMKLASVLMLCLIFFPSLSESSFAAIDTSKIQFESIYPTQLYPIPIDEYGIFVDVDGKILVASGPPPIYGIRSDGTTWHSLNTFIDGKLEGIPGFKITAAIPTYVYSGILEELAPGIFLAGYWEDCLLVQGQGCPPMANMMEKIVKSDGTILSPEIKLQVPGRVFVMDQKILVVKGVNTGAGSVNTKIERGKRNDFTQYSLFDFSDYSNAKFLWESPNIDSVTGTENYKSTHIFSDGSALIPLRYMDGDLKNCRNFLKFDSAGQVDTKWISDIEKKVVAKGGKSGFPLTYLELGGRRTGADRVIFSASTSEIGRADCKQQTPVNRVKIVTDNSGKVIDVILDSEYDFFALMPKVVECDISIGCIWYDKNQLSWMDSVMNRSASAPWFKIAPPPNFDVTFEYIENTTRNKIAVNSLITNWAESTLIGVKDRVATFLTTAKYKGDKIQSGGYKTFIAEYRIPDALYQVQAKIDAENAAKIAEEENRIKAQKLSEMIASNKGTKKITCKNGKKTRIVIGVSPKCPKGFKVTR